MKKVLASSVVVLMVLFLSAGFGLAGNGQGGGNGAGNGQGGGNGGGGNGNGDGTGISLVCSGGPIEITGTVSSVSDPGSSSGLKIDDGIETFTVYGIGPSRFWEEAEVVRPGIGDEVIVDGMEVTFTDGSIKIIAMSIDFVVDGTSIDLRAECQYDEDGNVVAGGWPLWRGGNGNSN